MVEETTGKFGATAWLFVDCNPPTVIVAVPAALPDTTGNVKVATPSVKVSIVDPVVVPALNPAVVPAKSSVLNLALRVAVPPKFPTIDNRRSA